MDNVCFAWLSLKFALTGVFPLTNEDPLTLYRQELYFPDVEVGNH